MNPPNATASASVQIVRDAYDALNRNDATAFVRDFDPQVERIEPSDAPGGGTFRGLDAVREHVAVNRGRWAEGSCEPVRLVAAAGDRVVVFVHVHVRLKDESAWREGDVVDVFTFRDGKIVQFRTFFDTRQGLEWAGVKSDE